MDDTIRTDKARKVTRYGNAEKIFPKELLDRLRQFFPSGMLWVPPDGSPGICEAEIIHLYRKGLSSAEIAGTVHRSQCRVNQILKKHKACMDARKNSIQEKNGKPETANAAKIMKPHEWDDLKITLSDLEKNFHDET